MSLLTSGPHTATVTLVTMPDDFDHNGRRDPIPGDTVTVVNCSFAPMSSDDMVAYGGKMITTGYKVTHVDWPGGPYSIVKWNDMTFRQVGDTLRNSRGRLTKHTTAYLESTTAKVR